MFYRCFACVVLVFLVQAAPNAWADPTKSNTDDGSANSSKANDAQAAALRADGLAFVKAGDCESALGPLRSAWALQEDASTAIPLAECELTLRQEPEAAHHLARALALLPPGAQRTRVETMLHDVSSRVARLDIVVNEPGAVILAGKFVVDAPAEDLFVEPGSILVMVKKSRFGEQSRTVHAVAGKTERLEFNLTRGKNDSDLDHPERSAPSGSMIPAFVGAGTAAVSIGLGIGLRVAGTNSGEDANALLEKLDGRGPCSAIPAPKDCASIKDLRVDHDRYVNASTGLFIGGGLLLGGAIVYGIVMSQKTQKDVAILPIVSPTNNGLLIQGRF